MQKIILHCVLTSILCWSNINECAQPTISNKIVPEGQLYIWSYSQEKMKSCNTYNPTIVDIKQIKTLNKCRHGELKQLDNQWYILDSQENTLISIKEMNPKKLFKLSHTRMHGTSAGNVCAVDNHGQEYVIESFERSKLGLEPVKAIIYPDSQPLHETLRTDASLVMNANVFFNIIKYSKNKGQKEKWLSGNILPFTQDQMESLMQQQSSGSTAYMTIIDQFWAAEQHVYIFFTLKQLEEKGIISRDITFSLINALLNCFPYLNKRKTFEIVKIEGSPLELNKHLPLDLHVTVLTDKDENKLEGFTVYKNAQLEMAYCLRINYEKDGKKVYDDVRNPIDIDIICKHQREKTPLIIYDENKKIAYEITNIIREEKEFVKPSKSHFKLRMIKYAGCMSIICGIMYLAYQSYDSTLQQNSIITLFNRLLIRLNNAIQ